MTREEREDAINFFKEVAEREVNNAKYSKLAIEALEQKTCDDVISRDCDKCAYYDDGANDEACDECFADEYEHPNFKPKAQDCISRQAVIDALDNYKYFKEFCEEHHIDWSINLDMARIAINNLPSVTPKEKIGYCKDCKWWKDNDGVYRRGVGAESKCPINRKEVYEGNGYCFMFEP